MSSTDKEYSAISLQPVRLALFGTLFILLSAGGLYIIYSGIAGQSVALNPGLFSWQSGMACAALLVIYFATDGLRLHYTVRALGYRLPAGTIGRLVFINLFFSNVTPLATGGGVAQVVYMQRHGVPLGTALTATTVRTMLAVILIFTAAPLFFMSLHGVDEITFNRTRLTWLALFIFSYLGFFTLVIFRTQWLLAPLIRILQCLRKYRLISEQQYRNWRFASMREMQRFSRGFDTFAKGKRSDIAMAVLMTFLFLLSMFSFPALLLDGLGYDVPYFTTIGMVVITTFIMYFAPTPGASGIAEGVFGHLFTNLSTPNHLILVTFTWRFLTIYLGMLIGWIITQHALINHGR